VELLDRSAAVPLLMPFQYSRRIVPACPAGDAGGEGAAIASAAERRIRSSSGSMLARRGENVWGYEDRLNPFNFMAWDSNGIVAEMLNRNGINSGRKPRMPGRIAGVSPVFLNQETGRASRQARTPRVKGFLFFVTDNSFFFVFLCVFVPSCLRGKKFRSAAAIRCAVRFVDAIFGQSPEEKDDITTKVRRHEGT
jgi:hypothetical protein